MRVCIVLAWGLSEVALGDDGAHKDRKSLQPHDSCLTWSTGKLLTSSTQLFSRAHTRAFCHVHIAFLGIRLFICSMSSPKTFRKRVPARLAWPCP